MNLFEFSPLVIGIVPVALGLVAAVKQIGLPSRFAPLASIAIGIGLVALTGQAWQADVAQGIIIGLAASGLWSGSKALLAPSLEG
jgi:hypothetical protein